MHQTRLAGLFAVAMLLSACAPPEDIPDPGDLPGRPPPQAVPPPLLPTDRLIDAREELIGEVVRTR